MVSLLARPMTLLLILLFGSALVIAQQPTRPAPASVEINGQVRYANGSAPADKVLVRLEFFGGGMAGQILTDRTGKFRFSGLTPAMYVLTVHSMGYVEIRQQIDLQTTFREYVQLQLTPEKSESVRQIDPIKIVDARVPAEARKEFDEGRAALLEQKKIEAGISHLEKAVSLYPDFLDAHLLLGAAYSDARQFDKAERELRRALNISPKIALAHFELGDLYRRQEKYADAERVLKDGLKLEPKSHQGHYTLGRIYFAKGDIAKAGPEVGRAIQLKPDFAEAYLLAGNLFLRAHNAEGALRMFEYYLFLAPIGSLAAEAREMVKKIKTAMAEKK